MFYVILNLRERMADTDLFRVLQQHPVALDLLVLHLKEQASEADLRTLEELYKQSADNRSVAFLRIDRALETVDDDVRRHAEDRQALSPRCGQVSQRARASWECSAPAAHRCTHRPSHMPHTTT